MRAFFVLGLFVAAASAASLGYQTTGQTGSLKLVKTGSTFVQPTTTFVQPTTTFVSGSGLSGRSLSGSTTFVNGNGNGVFGKTATTFLKSGAVGVQPATTFIGGNLQSRSSLQGSNIYSTAGNIIKTGGQTTFISLDDVDQIPPTVEYNKQVYYFSAPEEERNQGIITKQLSNILKKNLQVVFIKAPENNAATNAAIQLAKQAIEQRTAIYVLAKENDANQVIGQLQQIQENVQTTPEVAIIKYRTAEDLVNAQANIQAQYDNFGGVVPLINGGIVPVLNYASPAKSTIKFLDTSNLLGSEIKLATGPGAVIQGTGATLIAPKVEYLPPAKK